MPIAESFVYKLPDGKGHVGRKLPKGVEYAELICKPGGKMTDKQVAALGLKDLKDRNRYGKKAK